MKKVIAIALSLLLIISLLPMAAFAKADTEEIQAKMEAARDYLYGSKTEFTAAEGGDFYFYLMSFPENAESLKAGYIQSVKDAFDAGTMNTADRVAIAANCLMLLGEDTENFELNDGSKINLEEKMMEYGTTVDSPYNYYFILTQATDETYRQQVIDTIEANYTKGSGYDYWGFGTDNTANFGAIEAAGIYNQELIDDATEVVEKAKVDKGYYYLADYGTAANGNSTACALFFYAMNRDEERADEAYRLLVENFAREDGGFAYELDKESNAYATKDAYKALITYLWVDFSDDTADEEKEITDTEEPVVDETLDAAAPTGKQSTPATGDSFTAVAVAGSALLALGVALALRKKED